MFRTTTTHTHANHNTHTTTQSCQTIYADTHKKTKIKKKHPDSVTYIITNITHINQTPWCGEHVCAGCMSLTLLKFYDETWRLNLIQTIWQHQCLISASSLRHRWTHGVCGHTFTSHMRWVNGHTHTHTYETEKESNSSDDECLSKVLPVQSH